MKIFFSSLFILFLAFLVGRLYFRRYRTPEFALRLISLLIIIFFFLNINLVLPITRTESSKIALLIDQSESMADSEKISQLKTVLTDLKEYRAVSFGFSESLSTIEDYDKLIFKGRTTDITRALFTLSAHNPSAIILLSDGNHNQGPDPITALGVISCPIYTVGIGRELKSDAEIVEVDLPAYIFYGDKVEARVRVKYSGEKRTKGDIALMLSGKTLARQSVEMGGPGMQEFKFTFIPQELGRKILEVSLDIRDDNLLNNRYRSAIEVLKNKIALLYLSSGLNENLRFLKNAFEPNSLISPTFIVELTKGTYYKIEQERLIKAQSFDLDRFDVVILDNINLKTSPQATSIKKYVEEGGGLLILGGDNLSTFDDFLSDIFSLTRVKQNLTGPVSPVVASSFSVLKPGIDLPPFPGVDLYRTTGDRIEKIIQTQEGYLLFGFGKYYAGKVFLITGRNIGLWGFNLVGLGRENIIPELFVDIVYLLSPLGSKGRINLRSNKTIYRLNEEIVFSAETFTRGLKPAAGYEPLLEISGYSTKKTIPMVETGPGKYQAAYRLSEPGEFQAWVSADMEGNPEKSNRIMFTIGDESVEQIGPDLNKDLLVNLAQITNGRYLTIDQIKNFKPELKPQIKRQNLIIDFTHPIFIILAALFLILEWVLRRRKGEI